MNKLWLGFAAAVLLVSAAGVALMAQDVVIRSTTLNVVAPTTVKDKDGIFVNGLDVRDFVLRDNDKVQDNVRLDLTYVPISMVVVIQRSSSTENVLPTVQKIGSLLGPLVLGERGEAAIVTFDHRVEEIQSFTNDEALFKKSLEKLKPGSNTRAMSDAMMMASRMLRRRSIDHRRVILLISETQENGSNARVRDALLEIELNNIQVYSINMSRWLSKLTAKAPYTRPDPVPPSARPMPAGAANTPTTQAQMGGASGSLGNYVPALQEVFTAVKAIFIENPQEVFTKYSGGSEYSFLNMKGFETAMQRLGEELQSQYLLSYSPSTKLEGGWHRIQVEVRRPNVEVKARAGYWMAARTD
jgi:VWFA-related protein